MMQRTFWMWFPLAISITLVVGIAYALTQQTYRQSANDSADALALQVATDLTNGTALDTTRTSDISQSLMPFYVVYDASGKALEGTGTLNGALPIPPVGVLNSAKLNGIDRVTWQPQSAVRIASVIRSVSSSNGAFVLAGQSLARTEVHSAQAFGDAVIGWLITMITSFFAVGMTAIALEGKKK